MQSGQGTGENRKYHTDGHFDDHNPESQQDYPRGKTLHLEKGFKIEADHPPCGENKQRHRQKDNQTRRKYLANLGKVFSIEVFGDIFDDSGVDTEIEYREITGNGDDNHPQAVRLTTQAVYDNGADKKCQNHGNSQIGPGRANVIYYPACRHLESLSE